MGIPISVQRRNDLYKVVNDPEKSDRVNTKYKLDSKKVAETFSVDELGAKTAFCRCWKSSKFPLCDGAHGKHNQACGDNLGLVMFAMSTITERKFRGLPTPTEGCSVTKLLDGESLGHFLALKL